MPDRDVNLREIIKDIAGRMPDSRIMEKYKISLRGLADLYQQLIAAGYLVSEGQGYRIADKRQIKLEELVEDVRSGMSESELKKKYKFSSATFKKLMQKLDAQGFLLDGRPTVTAMSEFGGREDEFVPRLPRNYLLWPYPVYVLGDDSVTGWILDITETGLKVEGIEVQPGDTRTFSIIAGDVSDAKPFVIEVICRWTQKDVAGSWVSGFEIPRISDYNLEQLQKFIQAVALVA